MSVNSSSFGKAAVYLSFPLLTAAAAHAFFYCYTDLSARNSLIIYLSALLILVTLQYCLKKSLYHLSVLAPGSIAIAWSIAFVLFNYYGSQERFPFTQVMGNYLF